MGWIGDWVAALTVTGANPRASAPPAGGTPITTPHQLQEYLLRQSGSTAGQVVTSESAMRLAAVYGCVRLIAGSVSAMPRQIKRRVDEKTRVDASGHSLAEVLNRRPNAWQRPSQFVGMMQAHVLLMGNAYAKITRGARGQVIALTPLHPARVQVRQREDLRKEFVWTRSDGQQFVFAQDEMLHLFLLTVDGVRGISPIAHARQTIGLSLAMEQHGAKMFENGATISGALSLPADAPPLTEEQVQRLRTSMEDYRSGGQREGKMLLLEGGIKWEQMALAAKDAEWIEARKFGRTDIAMLFGVPPHMIGDTERTSGASVGIEAQTQGYVTFTLEPHLSMWEEALNIDCLDPAARREDDGVFVRFNRQSLVRGDIKTRWEAYKTALQWGVSSPNDVLAKEDENPREGGDIYYPPPNMTAAVEEIQ